MDFITNPVGKKSPIAPHSRKGIGGFPSTAPASLPDVRGLKFCFVVFVDVLIFNKGLFHMRVWKACISGVGSELLQDQQRKDRQRLIGLESM